MNIYENLESEKLLSKLFDYARLVNPIKKKIFHNVKDNISINEHNCYEFWKKGIACENCISIRAYIENKSFSKIDFDKDKVYFVMASPVYVDDNKCTIELFRDITDDGVVQDIKNKTIEEIDKEIKSLNDKIIKDDLVDCYNRRYINEFLPFYLERSSKENKSLSISIMDIDYFKDINDKYGHICGDFLLKEIVKIVKNNLREGIDWIGRYGGEEFMIVFYGMTYDKVCEKVEHIRKELEEHVFKWKEHHIRITASFGISFINEKYESINSIVDSVDKKLYKAKEKGRNKVVF